MHRRPTVTELSDCSDNSFTLVCMLKDKQPKVAQYALQISD